MSDDDLNAGMLFWIYCQDLAGQLSEDMPQTILPTAEGAEL